jgi:hypothetical protein
MQVGTFDLNGITTYLDSNMKLVSALCCRKTLTLPRDAANLHMQLRMPPLLRLTTQLPSTLRLFVTCKQALAKYTDGCAAACSPGTSALLHCPCIACATPRQQYMGTMAVELGPNGDDTFFVSAALDRANINTEIVDFELAVVGGTGRYKGATGEVFSTGTEITAPGNLYTVEIIVPKFKRF